MHGARLVADRDVFARTENVRAEAVTALVVVLGAPIVVEHPAGVLRPARLVHEEADLVLLAIPEPADPAVAPVLLPLRLIDVAVGLERRDELVAVPRRALRKLLRAGEVEPDALEIVRQRRHGTVSIV